jgi:RNA polymerase sigma-70 factor (ECF subfamily)
MDKKLYSQFNKIYNHHVEKIYRFVYVKVNSREIAEDLTSEVFLRFWKVFQRDAQEKIKNPKAFLYKMARNLISDYYRARSNFKKISIQEIRHLADPKQDLEKQEIFSSDVQVIQRALSSLKSDYQDVILWYYLDDLSVEEIAKILNKSENAVRVMIHRAMEKLRKILEKLEK